MLKAAVGPQPVGGEVPKEDYADGKELGNVVAGDKARLWPQIVHPVAFPQVMQREKDELVETIADEAHHGKLGKLPAGMTSTAFWKCPQAVEREVLHHRGDKAARVGDSKRKTQQLDENIEYSKIGN